MPLSEFPLSGIHHVTGITGDAQRNIDFYTGVLGLRLVKLTVNFDDPTTSTMATVLVRQELF